jgi:hypothetical protein
MNENTTTILDPIPFQVDRTQLLAALGMESNTSLADEAEALACEAENVARPKGVYKLSGVEPVSDNMVRIDGVTFTSRVLAVNLEGAHRAFPYVATCGIEMEQWSETMDDPVRRFGADTIKQMAVSTAIQALGDHLADAYRPGQRATMNPGSLTDWPIEQQRNLFALFGEVVDTIGVKLTESYLMIPTKSVSGIWFQSEKGFQNCQLCPRSDCPSRRAPYDPHLFDKRYAR